MDDQAANPASSAPAAAGLTDDHHDWASSFCGIDTRAAAGSGGLWGAIKGAAGGVINTAQSVAGDAGQIVSDAASGVVNTVTAAAGGVAKTVADAGSGMLDTAEKVAGDVAVGHLGQALGDAADGAVTTAGRVASDAAHAVIDTGSAALNATGKLVTDAQQTVADAATGAISTAGKLAGDVAQTVSEAAGRDSLIGRAAAAAGHVATQAAGAAVQTVKTVADFDKGVVEGVVGGVEGMAQGVVTMADGVGKEAYALATDGKAREQALNKVEGGLEAVGRFEAEVLTDPGQAAADVGDAVVSGATAAGKMAAHVYDQYEQAAAAGHGGEFLGKAVGQGAVLVAGAVLTDGASVAAEGGAVAAEGAVAVGELAATATEGASLAGEGLAVAGDTAAVATETAESTGALGAAAEDTQNVASAVEEAPLSEAPASEPPLSDVPESAPESAQNLDADAQRQADILEEFEERQVQYGGEQAEAADAAAAPDLEEPGRMEELDSGHDRTWEREDAQERLDQGKRENPYTPADHRGSWQSGNPGDGRWAPNNPAEYGLEEGQTVPFREGTPDFTEYATETPAGHPGTIDVEGLTGDSAADRTATIKSLAEREGVTPEEMEQWLADNKQRLHHFGGDEMQIVPEKLHALFHEGGASELRAGAAGRDMAQAADGALSAMAEADPEVADATAAFDQAEAQRMADLDPQAAATNVMEPGETAAAGASSESEMAEVGAENEATAGSGDAAGGGEDAAPVAEDAPAPASVEPEAGQPLVWPPKPPADLPENISAHWEKAAEQARPVFERAQAAEPALTRSVQGATEAMGGKMVGLEYRLKSAESLTRKIATNMANQGISGERAASRIVDAVRYTSSFEPDKLVEGTQATLKQLEADGNKIVKLRNFWLDETSSYKGINAQIQAPDGQVFETQFHTPESFWAKDKGTHAIYEQMRKLPENSPEWQALNEQQREITRGLRVPNGIDRIKSMKKES